MQLPILVGQVRLRLFWWSLLWFILLLLWFSWTCTVLKLFDTPRLPVRIHCSRQLIWIFGWFIFWLSVLIWGIRLTVYQDKTTGFDFWWLVWLAWCCSFMHLGWHGIRFWGRFLRYAGEVFLPFQWLLFTQCNELRKSPAYCTSILVLFILNFLTIIFANGHFTALFNQFDGQNFQDWPHILGQRQ